MAGKNSILIVASVVRVLLFINSVNCHNGTKEENSTKTPPGADTKTSLPQTLIPKNYDVFIYADVKEPDFKFNGKVIIQMTCIKDAPELVLHMKNLTIKHDAASFKCANSTGNSTKAKSNKYDEKLELYSLTFEDSFKANQEYEVDIPFEGTMNFAFLSGFYNSSYTVKETNKTSSLATTTFSMTNARYAFPCFDEPIMKATFSINIGHPKSLTAISTMPLDKSDPMPNNPDWVLDTFKKSPKMSTYMLAFVISDFANKESKAGSVQFRTWTHKDKMNQVDLAADLGPKCLTFLETYFKIKFPLPKVDLIAIPDAYCDSQDNWGLITYSESALLFDKDQSSVSSEYDTVQIIPRTLAAQWWGDLVTLKWWNDLWFVGALPKYVASLALAEVLKSTQTEAWTFPREDAYQQLKWVLYKDSESSSQPINIKSAGDVSEFLDLFNGVVAYDKGACLIRMLSMCLTDIVFQYSVKKFLEKNSYGNADHNDFWNILTKVAHQSKTLPESLTVNTIMDGWTNQGGFPILEIKREKNILHFTQKRFVTDTSSNKSGGSWWIPLTFVGPKSDGIFNSSQPIWLPGNSKSTSNTKDVIANGQLDVGELAETDWFLVNREMSVLMHINYDEKNWDLIIAQLKADHTKVPVMNRVQLILDTNRFSKYNVLSCAKVLDLLSYIAKEDEVLPWRAALMYLWEDLDLYLARTEKYEDFKVWARKLLVEKYLRLSSAKTDHSNYGVRMLVLRMSVVAAVFGLPEQEAKLRAEFDAWKKSPGTYSIDPDLGYSMFCVHVRNGSKADWETLYKFYSTTSSFDVKDMILSALSCAKDPEILTHYLEMAHFDNASKIALEDVSRTFIAVIDKAVGFKVAKDFLFNNTDKLYKLVDSEFALYVKYVYKFVMFEPELKEVQDYVAKNSKYLNNTMTFLKQYEEEAKNNIQWHKNNYKEVVDYLSANVKQ
ncbi:hypothetical protein WDU94_003299 [Cyamophila willieti]